MRGGGVYGYLFYYSVILLFLLLLFVRLVIFFIFLTQLFNEPMVAMGIIWLGESIVCIYLWVNMNIPSIYY